MNRLVSILLVCTIAAPALASPQAALAAILADVRALPPEVACRTRYAYAPQGEVLGRQIKSWANHLSREIDFGTPRPIGAGVIAFWLDDYQWDPRVWEKQLDVEPFFYYLLRTYYPATPGYRAGWYLTPEGKEIVARTHSRVPVVWGDWWFFYASRQIDLNDLETGAGYYDWLGVKNLNDFNGLRLLDKGKAIKLGDELRAALEAGKSRVTKFGVERQIEWLSSYGDGAQGRWITLDANDTRKGNTATGRLGDGELVALAIEAYIGIPNGLWAVGAFAAQGKQERQATVPDKIAGDTSPHHQGTDTRIHPFSCFHCHTNGGLQAVDDWARNRGLKTPNQLEAFQRGEFQRLKRQYFRDLDRQLAKGRARYTEALQECVGLTPENHAAEHAATYYAYIRPRSAADVAALLGVPENCLVDGLKTYFDHRNVQDLAGKKRLAGLIGLIRGETVPITYVEQFFGDLSCIAGGHK